MEKEKKIKFILATTYLLIISVFLWVFFENYSLNEITSYDFIKKNRYELIKFKNSNLFLISIIFFICTILWVLLLGFATPVCLIAGFIFGKWIGIVLVSLGLSIGSTFLYIFAKYFFKDLIEKKFFSRFISLNEKFKKNEFLFFLVYRFVGGIPFNIANILPAIFNVSKLNFFLGTFFGMLPQLFIWVSLGKGLEKIIDQNLNTPSLFQMLLFPDIYIPIIGFIILLVLGIIIKNFFYKI
tara:strand:- start:757 stop:1476 length:720 start_codon:yes stop_codon:yes gene_type:complete